MRRPFAPFRTIQKDPPGEIVTGALRPAARAPNMGPQAAVLKWFPHPTAGVNPAQQWNNSPLAARRFIPLLIVLLCFPVASAPAQEPVSPPQVVETLHAALLSVMKNAKSLGYAGRYRRLAPVIRSTYDLDGMVKIIAGYHWRKFTDAQKQALTDAFTRMTIATYAKRFDGFSGERFRTLSQETGDRGTALVKTRLVKSNGESIALDYRLKRTNGRWGIIDVYLKGTISELATRRAEYSSVIRRKGLESLLTMIEAKIKSYGKG